MANQNNQTQVNNQEQVQNQESNQAQEQAQQAQPSGTPSLNPEVMKKNLEPEMVPMDPRAAKALRTAKKILKVAIPFAAVGGAVLLGINIGGGSERKRSKVREDNLNGQINDLQRQLAERPQPALPTMDIPVAPTTVDPAPTFDMTHDSAF